MFKRYDNLSSNFTPNFEVSEGVRIAENFVYASYLPLVRFDKRVGDYKVVSGGKVLAVDSKNFLVPAGLAIDINTAKKEGNFDNCVNKYTTTDVQEGVRNFAGEIVTAGEPVVKSFFTDGDAADTQINFVGKPIGVAPYDGWAQNGAGYGAGYDAGSLSDTKYTNWSLQQGSTVLTRYYIELPVVPSASQVAFPGMTVFTGAPKPGDLVSFDALSNFKVFSGFAGADAAAIVSDLNEKSGTVLGKVTFIDDKWPKDYLEWVRTWNPNISGKKVTDVAPGSATKGLPDLLAYAGVTDPAQAKVARINLVIAGI